MAKSKSVNKKPVDTKSGTNTSGNEKKVSKTALEDKDESVKNHRAKNSKTNGL